MAQAHSCSLSTAEQVSFENPSRGLSWIPVGLVVSALILHRSVQFINLLKIWNAEGQLVPLGGWFYAMLPRVVCTTLVGYLCG